MTHRFDPAILREYDVRGVVGGGLDATDAYAIGRGFATRVRRAGGTRVAVGRDGRLSSPELESALIEGLTASGVDVVRLGLAPSPMLYWAEATLEVDGGVEVTGSHNPRDQNGFKMVLQHRAFFGEDIQDLATLAEATDWAEGEGSVEAVDLLDGYAGHLSGRYSGGSYRIAWDAGNGAAGPAIERLTQLLPGEHYLLFTQVDGNFPNHHPDPTDEANLADLKRVVADKCLDFGLAFDGDGDRIGAVDGAGRVLWGDQILSILAQPVLAAHRGATIIGDVKSSRMLFDRIAELGGAPVMGKTGHSLMKERMRDTGAPLAGELSGHIFFGPPDGRGYDDALEAAVRLIGAVHASGRSLTELHDAMPTFVNTPELRFPVDPARKTQVMDEILARLANQGASVETIDGARVATDDGWWLLRASNTQDVLTARAEARDQAGLERLLAALDAQLAGSGVSRQG